MMRCTSAVFSGVTSAGSPRSSRWPARAATSMSAAVWTCSSVRGVISTRSSGRNRLSISRPTPRASRCRDNAESEARARQRADHRATLEYLGPSAHAHIVGVCDVQCRVAPACARERIPHETACPTPRARASTVFPARPAITLPVARSHRRVGRTSHRHTREESAHEIHAIVTTPSLGRPGADSGRRRGGNSRQRWHMALDMESRSSEAASIDSTRYLLISSDCHAGAELRTYREYLPKRYLDEYDEWANVYVNPFDDLKGPDFDRNFNSDRRIAELEADGVVAEVLFPNTIPPFFPSGNLVAPQPSHQEYERRWAGLQAHNRWMADFCREAPGRRAGIAQIMLNDVDDAVAEIRWSKNAGLTGGILLPGVPPGAPVSQLLSAEYEPIWATCAELDVVINHHGGGASPDGLIAGQTGGAIYLIEQAWYSHRALWHLIFSGVFERHPSLKFVLTEQGGSSWIPGILEFLDFYYERFGVAGTVEGIFGGDAVKRMSLTPREYWARNCYV